MKITDVKTLMMDCYRTNWVFVKVCTDEGVDGVGEATLEFKEYALAGALTHLRDFLIGQDPHDIEYLTMRMYRDSYWKCGPVLMSAISGVEIALWDILGKWLGVPVYQLLGGKHRDRVKIYANGWFSNAKEPEEFAAKAVEAAQRGIKALKWDPFGSSYMDLDRKGMDRALACIGAVSEAVGDRVDLLIECHGRFNLHSALEVSRELEQFKPVFFEEPVPPDNIDVLAQVAEKSRVPVATG